MLKFFRTIRRNLLADGKTGKYLKYAIGEIVLVVLGILIALQINNWNEARKENRFENQLIHVLITDLQLKKSECQNDMAIGRRIIKRSDAIYADWKNDQHIDTSHLRAALNILPQDDWFFNENSPVYATFTGSGLWKQIPDSLARQIDDVYRSKFGSIKSSFIKQGEYSLHAKLTFLAPHHLLDPELGHEEVLTILKGKEKQFVALIELFKSGVMRLVSKFETTIPAIDQLIENLEFYKENKQIQD